MSKIGINVISNDALKELLLEISQLISDSIASTFGPYGQNTLIQSVDNVYSTKDGWTVMQNLRILNEDGGAYSVATNAIKKLIQDVAHAVVLNAGDGTTTGILAATEINKIISTILKNHPEYDTRAVEDALRKCTDRIIEKLQGMSTPITKDNMEDIIYKIACISTNWDTEISGLIRDIYVKTNNPIIKVEDSGTLETYAEYIEGYEIPGHLELENYYITSQAKGACEVENPIILTFGSPMHGKHFRPLYTISECLRESKQTLVLVAPTYDIDFLNEMKTANNERAKMKLPPVNVIPFKYFAKSTIDKDCVEDFTALTGSMFLSDQYEKINDVFQAVYDIFFEEKERAMKNTDPSEEDVKKRNEVINNAVETLSEISGTCEKIVMTNKYILASGLNNKDEETFKKRKEALENELFVKYKEANAESTLTDALRVKRIRLGKMECCMGIIKVGGFGVVHLKARKDSIDDATRACEVAYQDGYISDGCTAIPRAIDEVLTEIIKDPESIELDSLIARSFLDGFRKVAITLYNNRYHDSAKSAAIFAECMKQGKSYNLIEEEYTDELITPVQVCKEIMTGCLRLVLVNATSNQFIYKDEDELIRTIKAATAVDPETEEE